MIPNNGVQRTVLCVAADAEPLLYRGRDKKHPAEFMEDISVGNERLGEYISGLQKIGKKYDIAMSFFGHAGDGLLHIRPFLDLTDPAEVQKMRKIADEVFELAWSLGGTISGEHADGLARTGFVKKQYGNEYYDLLGRIKNIFDPNSLMNPGKIINDDPDVMVKNLRAEFKLSPVRLKTDLKFEKDELEIELEQCYGCGLCLSRDPDLRMCPVFRAMGGELASSRAKANILHFWATGQLMDKDFESPEFRKFLDLCINCKACLSECPSGVDVSKLMSTARAQYVKRRGLRRAESLLARNRYLSMLGSIFSPLSNLVMRLRVFKWLLENFTGLSRKRQMPSFERGSFLRAGRKYLASCKPIEQPIDKVAYFVDTYANYNDHELGFAAIDILRHNCLEVILPKQRPAPLPAIVYGDAKRAKKDLSYNVKHLAKAIRDGYKVVCSEPSAALCLRDELRHFVTGEDAKLVSENTFELMNYLYGLHKAGSLKTPISSCVVRNVSCAERNTQYAIRNTQYVYHLPCHLSAVGDKQASVKLLRELCGIDVVELKAGCCGLAGTFGMQKKNYELSSQIAARLKDALEKSPTKNVLTECAACKMQIEHISDCIVKHPIKVMARVCDIN